MRAAVCRAYGPPEVVEIDDLPAPPIGPGQVRVRVDAAAVNFPEVAAAHGAVHLVDHGSVDVRPALRELLPDGADVVVDPVGGDLSEPALRSLRWGGRFVTVG